MFAETVVVAYYATGIILCHWHRVLSTSEVAHRLVMVIVVGGQVAAVAPQCEDPPWRLQSQ